MKTKILITIGFLFLLSGVTLLVQTTSSNSSLGVSKTFAELTFFNSVGSDEEAAATYSGGQITSPVFPVKTIYEKVMVSLNSKEPPKPNINYNNITIPVPSITTDSH